VRPALVIRARDIELSMRASRLGQCGLQLVKSRSPITVFQGQESHGGALDLGGRPNSILRDAPTLCSPSAAPR
jgi:hypothetical protein